MGGSSQQPVTQQTAQTRDPWSAAQPHLIESMENAQGLFQSDAGYKPYEGATQAGLDPRFTQGSDSLYNMLAQDARSGGSAGVNAASGLGTSLIQNQGLNAGLQGALGQYGGIYGKLGDMYTQASTQENPYLQQMLEASNARIGNKINSSMSGAGRYGSGAHTDVMARGLQEAAAPVLAQDYQQRQQQRLAALQGQQAATGGMSDIYSGGLNRAGQWSQLMPTLDQARYAPAQGLMSLGQFYNERDQSALDDQIKLYNAQQSRPWEQLARYNAIAGQAGALGGSMTGSTTTPINQPSTLQRLLGGGLAGAGAGATFGPAGAGVGAAAGGLLGLLGR